MNDNNYVAHVSQDGREESVYQHLRVVAEMAASFAETFGGSAWAFAAGMLHDIGKYSDAFQRRLEGGPKVDHATAGAYVACRSGMAPLSYCIVGHHGGLPDGGSAGDLGTTLLGRLEKAEQGLIPSYERYQDEVAVPEVGRMPIGFDQTRLVDSRYRDSLCFSIAFFVRMVFSCLVDADYLCTERFMNGVGRPATNNSSLIELRDLLEGHLMRFYPPASDLGAVRCGVLDDCLRAAFYNPGVFSLTVPTGGGKTLGFTRFALQHSTIDGRIFNRVIVCEPYTSIIEQNAEVLRSVLGDENVLEHHSNFDFDDSDENSLRIAAENWDVPVVVTTNVQLFESLYANKTSRCRKLHNIARSVIVLDEAQMIPTKYLRPCVKVLSELVTNYGCSVVLCSASQPALSGLFEEEGIEVHEIASHPDVLVESLRRVQFRSLGTISDEMLVERLVAERQVLCIVNSRKQARAVYELVRDMAPESQPTYHLSTLMHPMHRSQVLDEIREIVISGGACTVVATSLVEAGVDLDFETVYRAVSGIDSMVQAAGRCNREMKRRREESMVYLFEPETSYALPVELSQRIAITKTVIEGIGLLDFDVNLDDLSVISRYFSRLHSGTVNSLDEKQIVRQLSQYSSDRGIQLIPFETVAGQFRLIEQRTYNVIIAVDANQNDVDSMIDGYASREQMRRLGRCSVSVYSRDRDALIDVGAIHAVDENTYLLDDAARYRYDIGLDLVITSGEAVFL